MKMISQIDRQTAQSQTESSPLAILLIDQNCNYIYNNPSFLKFSGLSTSEMQLKGWSRCLHTVEKESLFRSISEMGLSGKTCQKKTIRMRKNERRLTSVEIRSERNIQFGSFYILTFSVFDKSPVLNHKLRGLSFAPVTDQNRKVRLEGASIKVNNQFMKSQMRMEEYISELKASNHLKDKILAIISHDMSAPIASLKGLTSALLDEELSAKERALVRDSLLKQLDAVSDLTENLLRWATNSFEKKNVAEPENLILDELIERNITLIHPQSVAKNIKIKNDITPGLNIFANKDQVHIVMRNILTNALKYTPDGGQIHISCKAENDMVQIQVADTGIGMTGGQISNLFTYSQGNTYGTNGEKGIGLGLLLCKEYVEVNGGKIQVISENGKGTTVAIAWPASSAG